MSQKLIKFLILLNIPLLFTLKTNSMEQNYTPYQIENALTLFNQAVFFIKKTQKVNARFTDKRYTLLMLAAACNSSETVRIILEGNLNPDLTDESGQTALSYAVYSGNPTSVYLLLFTHVNANHLKELIDFTTSRLENENYKQIKDMLNSKLYQQEDIFLEVLYKDAISKKEVDMANAILIKMCENNFTKYGALLPLDKQDSSSAQDTINSISAKF